MKASIVTADQIRAMQNNEEWNNRFVIVDVRAKAETDVSIIPDAITKAEFERNLNQYQGKVVIAYCTIGYRSGIYANNLGATGWRAYNYEGGILDWCKHRLSLVTTNGQATTRVHTYSSRYSVSQDYTAVH